MDRDSILQLRGLAIHHPLIHILVSLQLALWSPVLCCCAIKGAIGQVTGVISTTCVEDGCCVQPKAKVQPTCCASSIEGTVDDALTVSGVLSANEDAPGCTCHERITDRISIDTGGKVSVPVPQFIGLFALAVEVCDGINTDQFVWTWRMLHHAHPPPDTLVSRHILLLI